MLDFKVLLRSIRDWELFKDRFIRDRELFEDRSIRDSEFN